MLGTGTVGRTLAARLAEVGHDVTVGTRDPGATAARDDHAVWAAESSQVPLQRFSDAAAGSELVVLACGGAVAEDVLGAAAEHLDGTVVLDLGNPLDFSGGFPPTLFVKDTDSLAETLQRAFPQARVVKTLNTMNASVMADPARLPDPGTVFVCGDDAAAKDLVTGLLTELGHTDVLDLGALEAARGTEMFLPLWLRVMQSLGTAEFNVKVVRA